MVIAKSLPPNGVSKEKQIFTCWRTDYRVGRRGRTDTCDVRNDGQTCVLRVTTRTGCACGVCVCVVRESRRGPCIYVARTVYIRSADCVHVYDVARTVCVTVQRSADAKRSVFIGITWNPGDSRSYREERVEREERRRWRRRRRRPPKLGPVTPVVTRRFLSARHDNHRRRRRRRTPTNRSCWYGIGKGRGGELVNSTNKIHCIAMHQ